MRPHRTARFGCVGSLSRATSTNATNAKTSVPPARPSRPSVRLTPFAAAMIANAAKAMYTHGSIITKPMNGTAMRSIAYVFWIWYAAATATTTSHSIFWRALIPSPVFAFR